MSKKPFAEDWQEIHKGLEYSESKDLYWHKGQVYDELSASHNGLIGLGAVLKSRIKQINKKEVSL